MAQLLQYITLIDTLSKYYYIINQGDSFYSFH